MLQLSAKLGKDPSVTHRCVAGIVELGLCQLCTMHACKGAKVRSEANRMPTATAYVRISQHQDPQQQMHARRGALL